MALNDESLMLWGKFKGEKMANVPAHYLIWCYANNKCCKLVKQYIEENKDVLENEIKKYKCEE